jgi:Ca2+-transporting ATPase
LLKGSGAAGELTLPQIDQSDEPTGLTEREALARLAADGPNALPGKGRRSFLLLLKEVLEEPMLLLLLGAGLIYMVLGDVHDAAILLAFASLSVVIEVVQEGRTDRAIAALGELEAPRATVIREGHRHVIPASQVVRGDLVVIAEGERVAADGWLIEANGLQIDQSVLTGESVPVLARALGEGEVRRDHLPGGDGSPMAYLGTLAVSGNGLMEVSATGPRSRMGAIGQSLATLEAEQPRLAIQTRKLVRWAAIIGLGVSILAAVLFGLTRGGWLDAALAGIALAMSMLPEELPVVLALFLTMGALRMSRARVLARRGAAIESLGAATVLCTDKTGTLTQNRMEIAQLCLPDGRSLETRGKASLEISEPFVELAGLGILASLEQPFDPMETAFHELGEAHEGPSLSWRQEAGWRLQRQYGLTPELLAVSHAWSADGEDHLIATKGAPEAIAGLCGLDGEARAEFDGAVKEMAGRGLRVLGVAQARWKGAGLPDSPHHFDFTLKGLVGLADPIRESVPDAVRQLRDAGVRVVMITGDYPETARAIAAQAGIANEGVLSGPEIAAMDDAELSDRIRSVGVLARIMPEQKLRIVEAFKAAGEIVAMTGDGVNDAPSIKAAHIGIAMGKRGTDVAREASAIVLLDDDFSTIPVALALGRRIYDNLRKAMAFIFAVHVPIAGLALAPLLTGWPIILGPVHIALLEMVIDPVCSLAFEAEAEEPDVMRRPPRDPNGSIFPRSLLFWSFLQGAVVLALLLGLAAMAQGMEPAATRATVFAGLVGCVLVLVAVNRRFGLAPAWGRRANRPLAIILMVVLAFFTLLFGVPAFAGLFRFALPGMDGLGGAGLVMAAALLAISLLKPLFRHRLTG